MKVSPQTPDSQPAISQIRRQLVARAVKNWIERLIDLSRRNNLLYFRDLKLGTLDLSGADPNALSALRSGQPVNLRRLFPSEETPQVASRLIQIQRKALSNLEERGLDTLFAAHGLATWPSEDEGRPTSAPVVLLPLKIERRGSSMDVTLQRNGDAQLNSVLLHALRTEHRVEIPSDTLDQENEADGTFDQTLDRLKSTCRSIDGFAIERRLVVGNFAFHKMAIVNDLRDHENEVVSHDLLAAVAGDPGARAAISSKRQAFDATTLDRTPPDQEFLVLDADSSQQAAIARVLAGQDGTIQGPPGTGKSQTIANLIAELAARGKRVLFVAEKRAALDVVIDRLSKLGLGHLLLDLHGAELSRKEIMARLATSLDIASSATPAEYGTLHEQFGRVRRRLMEHLERLHARRPPSDLSAFDLQGKVLRFGEPLRSQVRWRGNDLMRLNSAAVREIQEVLSEAAAHSELFLEDPVSPWSGAVLKDGHEAQQAIDRIHHVLQETFPIIARLLESLIAATHAHRPITFEQADQLVTSVENTTQFCQAWDSSIFCEDLDVLVSALKPAARPIWGLWSFLTERPYRNALKLVRSHRRSRASASRILSDLVQAREIARAWTVVADSPPVPHDDIGRLRAVIREAREDLKFIERHLPGQPLESISLQDLTARFQHLLADQRTAHIIPRLRRIREDLELRGCGAFLREILQRRPPAAAWSDRFEYAWLSACLDKLWAEEPELAAFSGRSHDSIASEFRRLDAERIRVSVERVARAHAEHVFKARNSLREQDAVVTRETMKKARHLPFRRLVQEAGDLLTVIRPCWMASPLAVSQLLPADKKYFDVVLFDEASQVLPEDAAAAVLRAEHVVVAGDRHQLPPTSFFEAADEEDASAGAEDPSSGFESFLDLVSSVCEAWSLDWHYRSRDEALIAFSNYHIYADRLVTFPGPRTLAPIQHLHVDQEVGIDGQEDSVSAEVERVVDLVFEHARVRPRESLGVIAMGIKHSDRIQAALDRELVLRRDLDEFFEESKKERFFVKNLERVQGDERDAIILSIGYGKDRAGRLLYRFGPLLMDGGERRLNVAITRARNRLTLVSSFTHHDMDPDRSSARGVELLRLYLEYAASGGAVLGRRQGPTVALNDFEQDVLNALTARGIRLSPQWGASKYRLDFAAQHPEKPGRFVLAIECDGATYHSTPTARDRDRLRQEHLQALGWKFHRIWSTDWFMNRATEIDRAFVAYETAIAAADRTDARGDNPEPQPPSAAASRPNLAYKAPNSARGPKPAFRYGLNIQSYSQSLLEAMVRWVKSDGRLRTDDEIVGEVAKELGFIRRGSRIENAIRRAIASAARLRLV